MRLLSMSLPVIIGFSLACKGSVGKSSAKPASNSPATSEDPSAASDVATTVDVSAIVESGGNSLSLVANTVKVKVKRLGGEEVTTLDATLGSGGDFTAAVPADTFVVLQVEGGEGGLSTLIAPVGAADGADKAIPVNTESSIAAQMAETAVASAEAKELLDADGKLAFLDVVGLYESAKILVDDAIENGGKIDESALKALVGAFVAANVATVTELKQEGVAGAMLAEVFVKPAGKLMSAVKEAFASDGVGKLLSGALEKAEDAKSIDTLGKALANADEKAIGTLAAVVVKKAIKDAVKEARKSDKQMSDEDKQQLAALIAGQYAGADPSTLKKLADKSDAGFVNTVNAIKNATGGVGEALSQVLASLPPEVQAKVAEKQALEAAKAQGNGAIDGDELAKLMAEKCQALGGSYDPKASTPCTVPPAADAACKDPAQLWKSQDQASCTKLGGVWKTATKSVDECLKENGLALADDTCSDPGSYSYCETALLYASKSSCEQFCGAKWTASTEDSGGTGATADDTDMKLSLMLQSGSTKPVESCSFSNGPSGDQAATAPSQEVDEGEADSSDAADTDEGGSAIETEEPCSTVSLTDEVDFVTCKKGNLEQTCAAQFGELWKIGSWLDKETFCTWKR